MAVVAVPWMLFPKPFILRKLNKEVVSSFFVDVLNVHQDFILFFTFAGS
jgi:hypothetical protein